MNYYKFLNDSSYNWKDIFIFAVDVNKSLYDLIKSMSDEGMFIEELAEEEIHELIDYLTCELRDA